ncbi:DUF418 domain-containing protein [Nocardiopsis nanhaiensis]
MKAVDPSATVPSEGAGPAAASADGGAAVTADDPARRVAFLDVARAVAMVGVVMMNAHTIVFAAERLGERDQSAAASAVDAVLGLLMAGKARAMLMVLLGVGAALAWRAAERRGGRPMALMLRRYAVLGVLFGVPHLLVFPGDILTHYALTALVLAPLMPFLLGGAESAFWFAVAAFSAAPLLEYLAGTVGSRTEGDVLVTLVPQTLGFFCVGLWLAHRPELAPEAAEGPSRLPLRMVWTGLVGQVLGLAVLYGSDLLFPMETDAVGAPVHLTSEGMPVVAPGAEVMVSFSGTLTGLGGALFFLGLVWWLVRRNGPASRALGALAPLGRMTLSVYLGSTAVFLLTMKPFEGEIPLMAQYGIGVAYFVLVFFLARWWLRAFRLGPLEWVWRRLTHLRPIPMRRGEGVHAA